MSAYRAAAMLLANVMNRIPVGGTAPVGLRDR